MMIDRRLHLAGLQCPKRMYWIHRQKPGDGAGVRLAYRYGEEAKLAARALFPEGHTIEASLPWKDAVEATRDLMTRQGALTIFDACLEVGGAGARVDVLERSRRQKWYITAVKSGGSVEIRHVHDLAFQTWVARESGMDIRTVQVLSVDRSYRRGAELDVQSLFRPRDVTTRVESLLASIQNQVARDQEILSSPNEPLVSIGEHCEIPFPCEFIETCWPKLPKDDVRRLPSLHGHRKRELLTAGIERMADIPPEFQLSDRQRRARQSVMEDRLLWSDSLNRELASLQYPLWCIDFEALAPAVPRYEGTRPWQQIPFQWSAHRLDSPLAEPVHFNFLGDSETDPRHAFVRSLLDVVTGSGSVLVWSQQFEDSRLKELQADFPALTKQIATLRARFVDLLEIVRGHIYHPNFLGSFSIKSVLPALVPELTYEGMAIARGDEACLAWDRLCRDELTEEQRASLRAGLEEYCRLDTFAMVRILQTLNARVLVRRARGNAETATQSDE